MDNTVMTVGILFLIFLGVLWFFLPFAIFGIKGKLEDILSELRKANAMFDRKD